jgi:hypothetical protein
MTRREKAALRLALLYARRATDAAVWACEQSDGRDDSASRALLHAANTWGTAEAMRCALEGGMGGQPWYMRRIVNETQEARRDAGLAP